MSHVQMSGPRQLLARRHVISALALVSYVAISTLLFGRGVLSAPHARVVGDAGSDKTISMWALAWWPHALLAGQDPFHTDVVWAPGGMDLSWVAAIPGAALVAAPLTLTAGPVVAYNVLALLAPATAGWAAFLLARWLTASDASAYVAGLLFGFSSYEIGQTVGHLHLTIALAIPLSVLLVLRRFAGELTRTRFLALLTVVLSAQFLISTEIFLMLVGVGLISFVLAWFVLERRSRACVRLIAVEALGALAVTAAVVSPYLVHAFVVTGPDWAPGRSPFDAAADLANIVVPERWTWLRPPGSDEIVRRFTANPVESTAYLGLPLLVIVLVFAFRAGRRSPGQRLLLALLATCAALSFGAVVRLAGFSIALSPWELVARAPIGRNMLPVRMTVFVSLFAALVCALWLAERSRSKSRWLLALVAVAVLLPRPSSSLWASDVRRAAYFTDGRPADTLRPADVILVLPFGKSGWSMLWQAESGFGYRMVGGRLGNFPPDERRWLPVMRGLLAGEPSPEAVRMLPAFLAQHDVEAIVVTDRTRDGPRRLVKSLGLEPERVDGALVYTLGPAGPVRRTT